MVLNACREIKISIHALREEGDAPSQLSRWSRWGFLSTPSVRRATGFSSKWPATLPGISIHALREEGDSRAWTWTGCRMISIHALREEGDGRVSARVQIVPEFLSTPSVRRATCLFHVKVFDETNFYPRPP